MAGCMKLIPTKNLHKVLQIPTHCEKLMNKPRSLSKPLTFVDQYLDKSEAQANTNPDADSEATVWKNPPSTTH